MIEHGFNYTVSAVKEGINFFETRVENLENQGERMCLPMARVKRRRQKRGNKITPNRVL